jgi:tetratricopeptide (TPR) repeat protein
MAVEGSIKELSLVDLLQLLSLNQKNGILKVTDERGWDVGTVYLKKGMVAYAWLAGRKLGELMVRDGLINDETLDKIDKMISSGQAENYEDALGRMELVTQTDLKKFLRVHAEESVYSLCERKDGFFKFEEGDVPLTDEMTLSIKTENLIMEGLWRMDEWSRITKKIPSFDLVPTLTYSDDTKPLELEPGEWSVLSYVDGKKSVREITTEAGGEFETAKILSGLVTSGIVDMGHSKKASQSSTEMGIEHLDRGRKFLVNKMLDRAIDEFRAAAKLGYALQAHLLLGDAYYQKGMLKEATTEYNSALNLNPNDSEIYYRLGFCYAKSGDFPAAISAWEVFLEMSPNHAKAAKARELLKEARHLKDSLDMK